jgi:hypothetical protein
MVKDLNLEKISDKKSLTKLLDLESSCMSNEPNNRKIDDFIHYLNNETQAKDVHFSPHFGMAYYLTNKTVSQLIKCLNGYLHSINYTFNASNAIAKFTDESYDNYTFQFVFQNQDDVRYARNLIKIYNILLSKFIQSRQNVLNKYSEQ